MDAAIRDRLLKIYRLANDSGATDGERAVAIAMLHKLLNDHGLTLENLIAQMGDPVSLHEFEFDNQWERRLITCVIGKVTDAQYEVTSFSYRDKRRKKNVVLYELTAAQAVEAARMYQFYRDALKDEFDLLLSAFIQKHHLFSSAPPQGGTPDAAMLIWLIRMQAMKNTLQELPSPLTHALTSGRQETQ